MKHKTRSKILSWVLTLALALSLVPTALAANHQISINKDKLSINVGETADLIVTGGWTTSDEPLSSPYYIQWSSSDNNVVRVSGKGSAYFTDGSQYAEVTGLRSGSAIITGELKAGQGDSGTIDAIHKVTCQVTVTGSAEVSIKAPITGMTGIPAGESRVLSAAVTGGAAGDYNFEWTSTGPAVYIRTDGESWSHEKTSSARFDFPASGSGIITVRATPKSGGATVTDSIAYSVTGSIAMTVRTDKTTYASGETAAFQAIYSGSSAAPVYSWSILSGGIEIWEQDTRTATVSYTCPAVTKNTVVTLLCTVYDSTGRTELAKGQTTFTITPGSTAKISSVAPVSAAVGETKRMEVTLTGLTVGQQYTLTASPASGNSVYFDVSMMSTAASSSRNIMATAATQTVDIYVTGKSPISSGSVTVTLTDRYNTLDSKTGSVSITNNVNGISLNRSTLTVPANLTNPGSLTATLGRNLSSSAGYTVRWYSSNTDYVRVGNSINTGYFTSTFNASATMTSVSVYGITYGRSATIYAELLDNQGRKVGDTQSCLVTVGQNGNVTLSPTAGTPSTSTIVYLNNYSSSSGGYYATFSVIPYVGNTVASTNNGYYVTYSWTLNGSTLNSTSSSYTLYAYGLSNNANHRLRCTANVYQGTTSAAVSINNLVGSNYLEWTVNNSAYSQINVSATVYDSGSYALGDVDLDSNRSVVEKISSQIASGYYLYSVAFSNNTDTRGSLSASRNTDYYASGTGSGRNYLSNVTFSPSASSGTAVFNFTALAYPNNNYGSTANARTYSGTLTFHLREGSAGSSITYTENAGNNVSLNARDFQDWWTGMYSRGTLNYVTFTSVSGGGTLYHNYTNSGSTNVVSRGTSCYANPTSSQVGINNLTFVPSNSSANTVNIRFTASGTTGNSSGTYTRTGTLTILYVKGDVKLEYTTGSDGTVSLKSSDFTDAYRNAVGSTSSNLTFRFKNIPSNGTLTYKSGSSTITLTNSNINNQTFTPSTIGNVTYTARNNTASNLTDTVEFTCYSGGTARFVGTITFNAKPAVVQNLVVRYNCTDANGVELDPIKFWNSAAAVMNSRYVTFGVPSGGSLYLNGAALSANTKLSFLSNSGYQVFSGVSYRPAAGASNGTITFPFQAYDANGSLVASGTVQITLNLPATNTPSTPKPVVPNVKLTDVPANSWYAQYVNPLVNAGVIGGFGDNTFRPKEDVTYGQALALIMRAVGINVQQGTGSTWAMPYLVEAASRGLLPNVPYGLNDSIDRNAIAYITAKAMNLTPVTDTSNSPFPDSKDPYVLALYNAGIIAGSDKGFEGSKSLSRAEVSAIIWRIYDKQGNGQVNQGTNQSTSSDSDDREPDRDAPFGY